MLAYFGKSMEGGGEKKTGGIRTCILNWQQQTEDKNKADTINYILSVVSLSFVIGLISKSS